MTQKEFTKQWDKAKSLNRSAQLEQSIELYKTLVPFIDNIESIFLRENYLSNEHYIKQMHFERAMFWGDFTAPLCDNGLFEEALQASQKAIYHKDAGNLTTLLYIFYNTGNIYLSSKNYKKALEWYDKALYENEVNKIWLNENVRADYYTNKAEALYFLEDYEEAEKWFSKAIKAVQNYKYFEPFYFLSKINKLKGDNKQSEKFYKMYMTRKSKITDAEFLQRTRFYPINIE